MSRPRFVVVDAAGAESDTGRFIRDGLSRTIYECGGVSAARCLTGLLNERTAPSGEPDALTRGERAELLAWRRVDRITSSGKLYTHKMIHWLEEARRLRAENEAASGGGDGDSAAVGPNPGVKPADSTATDPSPPAAEPEPTDNDPDPSITEMGRRARESWGRENPWEEPPAGRAAAEPLGLLAAAEEASRWIECVGDPESCENDPCEGCKARRDLLAATTAVRAAQPPLKRRAVRDELAYLLDSTVDLPRESYDRDTLLSRLEAAVLVRVGEATTDTAIRAAAADAPDMVVVRREDVLDAARCARGMLMLALEGRLRAAAERAAEGPR